jgi:fatty-acyl-CoA synthase
MESLLQTVLRHAEKTPERVCVQIYSHRPRAERERTYGRVVEDARRAAASYRARGVGRGDLVALMGGHDLDLYGAWLGALWVGAAPVVLAEPSVRIDREIYRSRLSYLLSYMGAKVLALSGAIEAPALPAGVEAAPFAQLVAGEGAAPEPHRAGDDELMLLQHSSGTTGIPKGVALTHGMVGRYWAARVERLPVGASDCYVTWLPLYHDLGLIECFVAPMFAGASTVWLSPFEWVADPEMLLDAITEHRGTVAYMPNFAFALVAASVDDAKRFDLSSLRLLCSCGEPILGDDVETFLRRLEGAGLRREAFVGMYGMAEGVCAVATSGEGVASKFVRVRKADWQGRHVAVPAGEDATPRDAVTHASSGVPLAGGEVRAVGPGGETLPPGHAGRLLARAPYLFRGYFRRDDLNEGLFGAEGFYDTGDVGYVDNEGHVFVTGRLKDLIIVAGRNVYNQDVESVVNGVPGVRAGRAVCFGVPVPGRGTEGAVLLLESDLPEVEWPELAARVRDAVASQVDLDLADVKVAPRGVLRKSTAGKLARSGNRSWYLEGRFGDVPRAFGGVAARAAG